MRRSILCGALVLTLAGCGGRWWDDEQGPGTLRVLQVLGLAHGGSSGSSTLDSDVLADEGIFEDFAQLTVALVPKNPTFADPVGINGVSLERYEVVFFRTDGRNVEGVDVPYRFTGVATGHVAMGSSTTISVEVVRHQAKAEPPLRNLVNGNGGESIITCIAEITVHGRSVAGDVVSASGRLQITFANFGG